MNITAIILATAVIGITGLLIGLLLGIAGKKFAVEVDEKEIEVRALLPEIIVGDVVMRAVMPWHKRLQMVKHLPMDVL